MFLKQIFHIFTFIFCQEICHIVNISIKLNFYWLLYTRPQKTTKTKIMDKVFRSSWSYQYTITLYSEDFWEFLTTLVMMHLRIVVFKSDNSSSCTGFSVIRIYFWVQTKKLTLINVLRRTNCRNTTNKRIITAVFNTFDKSSVFTHNHEQKITVQ